MFNVLIRIFHISVFATVGIYVFIESGLKGEVNSGLYILASIVVIMSNLEMLITHFEKDGD